MADEQINSILSTVLKVAPLFAKEDVRGERAGTELYTHYKPRNQNSKSTKWRQTAVLLYRKQKLQLPFS